MAKARNPQWADEKQSQINLLLDHPQYGEIPFTASPGDCEELGRLLFADAVSGKFGVIAAYVPPPPDLLRQHKEIEVRSDRDRRLAASDWTQLPDVPLTTKSEWAAYRQALRDVTNQTGFPFDVAWPTPPL